MIMKAEIYTKEWWLSNCDAAWLKQTTNQAIKESGHEVLNVVEHHFEPYGYTCLYLISESHVAIHTFPEHNTAFIQISSCSKPKFKLFCKVVDNL